MGFDICVSTESYIDLFVFDKENGSDLVTIFFCCLSLVFSKLLERYIHQTFYSYLNGINLIHVAQSGFRNLFSSETALINIVNKWVTAIDNDSMFGVILLDIQNAFDLIHYNILLQKLEIYKCSDKTKKLFRSYLTDRLQCTKFKGSLSEKLLIKMGVPQPSILGPLFFILFINDLPMTIKNSETDMYADDSSISNEPKPLPDLNMNLTEDMANVSLWLQIPP